MSALVSIIIPCFNAERWLGETVESCLAQTHSCIQVVVVDNGSTDSSGEILRRFKDSRVIVTNCDRKGASAARNRGLDYSRGEYIQFLDADDILAPDKIEIQLTKLAASPKNMIASAAWARFEHNLNNAIFKYEAVWADCSAQDFLIRSWLGGGMMPIFGWLIPRVLMERAGPWDESLSLNDDGEYMTRVLLASSGILFCEKAKGYYRSRIYSSLSKRVGQIAAQSDYRAVHQSCAHLLAVNDSMAARKACAAAYQRFAYRYYPSYRELTCMAERRVYELGGSDLMFSGGWRARLICALFGWKMAKRLQNLRGFEECRAN